MRSTYPIIPTVHFPVTSNSLPLNSVGMEHNSTYYTYCWNTVLSSVPALRQPLPSPERSSLNTAVEMQRSLNTAVEMQRIQPQHGSIDALAHGNSIAAC